MVSLQHSEPIPEDCVLRQPFDPVAPPYSLPSHRPIAAGIRRPLAGIRR